MPPPGPSDPGAPPSTRLRSLLNFLRVAVDKTGVDQVSRPMQIALVAVVLLAGMWFTVLKPKPATDTVAATPVTTAEPVAPGVKGLTSAVAKAKAAAATSDATNAKIQKATGSSPAASSPAAAAKPAATKATPTASKGVKSTTAPKAKAKTTATVKTGTKVTAPAAAKTKPAAAATPAKTAAPKTAVDPSDRLLAFLAKGKTLVILFHGAGADDTAARKAVHRTALADPKHVVSAYIPIGDVGKYEAITTDVSILSAPSILVIGTDGKATLLTGYVDAAVVAQTVGDARRAAAKAKSAK